MYPDIHSWSAQMGKRTMYILKTMRTGQLELKLQHLQNEGKSDIRMIKQTERLSCNRTLRLLG